MIYGMLLFRECVLFCKCMLFREYMNCVCYVFRVVGKAIALGLCNTQTLNSGDGIYLLSRSDDLVH